MLIRGLGGLFKALDSRYRRSLRGLFDGCLDRALLVELWLLVVVAQARLKKKTRKFNGLDLDIEAYIGALEAL